VFVVFCSCRSTSLAFVQTFVRKTKKKRNTKLLA
jgi:hypothetical protein